MEEEKCRNLEGRKGGEEEEEEEGESSGRGFGRITDTVSANWSIQVFYRCSCNNTRTTTTSTEKKRKKKKKETKFESLLESSLVKSEERFFFFFFFLVCWLMSCSSSKSWIITYRVHTKCTLYVQYNEVCCVIDSPLAKKGLRALVFLSLCFSPKKKKKNSKISKLLFFISLIFLQFF